MSLPKLVTLKELARLLGKSENSIRYHVRMGRIVPTLKLGRSMSFDPEEVLNQLKQRIRFFK